MLAHVVVIWFLVATLACAQQEKGRPSFKRRSLSTVDKATLRCRDCQRQPLEEGKGRILRTADGNPLQRIRSKPNPQQFLQEIHNSRDRWYSSSADLNIFPTSSGVRFLPRHVEIPAPPSNQRQHVRNAKETPDKRHQRYRSNKDSTMEARSESPKTKGRNRPPFRPPESMPKRTQRPRWSFYITPTPKDRKTVNRTQRVTPRPSGRKTTVPRKEARTLLPPLKIAPGNSDHSKREPWYGSNKNRTMEARTRSPNTNERNRPPFRPPESMPKRMQRPGWSFYITPTPKDRKTVNRTHRVTPRPSGRKTIVPRKEARTSLPPLEIAPGDSSHSRSVGKISGGKKPTPPLQIKEPFTINANEKQNKREPRYGGNKDRTMEARTRSPNTNERKRPPFRPPESMPKRTQRPGWSFYITPTPKDRKTVNRTHRVTPRPSNRKTTVPPKKARTPLPPPEIAPGDSGHSRSVGKISGGKKPTPSLQIKKPSTINANEKQNKREPRYGGNKDRTMEARTKSPKTKERKRPSLRPPDTMPKRTPKPWWSLHVTPTPKGRKTVNRTQSVTPRPKERKRVNTTRSVTSRPKGEKTVNRTQSPPRSSKKNLESHNLLARTRNTPTSNRGRQSSTTPTPSRKSTINQRNKNISTQSKTKAPTKEPNLLQPPEKGSGGENPTPSIFIQFNIDKSSYQEGTVPPTKARTSSAPPKTAPKNSDRSRATAETTRATTPSLQTKKEITDSPTSTDAIPDEIETTSEAVTSARITAKINDSSTPYHATSGTMPSPRASEESSNFSAAADSSSETPPSSKVEITNSDSSASDDTYPKSSASSRLKEEVDLICTTSDINSATTRSPGTTEESSGSSTPSHVTHEMTSSTETTKELNGSLSSTDNVSAKATRSSINEERNGTLTTSGAASETTPQSIIIEESSNCSTPSEVTYETTSFTGTTEELSCSLPSTDDVSPTAKPSSAINEEKNETSTPPDTTSKTAPQSKIDEKSTNSSIPSGFTYQTTASIGTTKELNGSSSSSINDASLSVTPSLGIHNERNCTTATGDASSETTARPTIHEKSGNYSTSSEVIYETTSSIGYTEELNGSSTSPSSTNDVSPGTTPLPGMNERRNGTSTPGDVDEIKSLIQLGDVNSTDSESSTTTPSIAPSPYFTLSLCFLTIRII